MPLPVPFPIVSGRYEVGPSMRRFGQAAQGYPAEEGHFLPDGLLAETLAAKLKVLKTAAGEAHLVAAVAPGVGAPGPQGGVPVQADGLRAALIETFQLVGAEHPDMVTVGADVVTLSHLGLKLSDILSSSPRLTRVAEPRPDLAAMAPEIEAWLAGREGLWLLGDALALSVQEDLALVRVPGSPGTGGVSSGNDVLEWLHVCLPSGWAPAEKIGRSFASVHEPVAGSQQLLASSEQIVRAMIHAGPFVRYVWGIHTDPELCHNPRLHRAPLWPREEGHKDMTGAPWTVAGQAVFRVERQTTRGFPHLGRALFTIRYWVEPLVKTAADPWRRERLISALAGMNEAELRYKGLTEARDPLVAWLKTPPA